MKLIELNKIVRDLMKDLDNHELDVLVDTEARCFDAHCFNVKHVGLTFSKEDALSSSLSDMQAVIISLEGLESCRPNRDEHIDLVRYAIAICEGKTEELKEEAGKTLEYYFRESQ